MSLGAKPLNIIEQARADQYAAILSNDYTKWVKAKGAELDYLIYHTPSSGVLSGDGLTQLISPPGED
jgi:hypothetical protein